MTSLYLHIGTEKTGSTTIQNLLSRLVTNTEEPYFLSPLKHNRAKLANGNFIGLYRWIRGLPHGGAMSTSQLHRRIHRFLSRLGEESRLQGNLPVFLSNEHISRFQKEEVEELISRLSAYFDDIHVVCFLRAHVPFALSMLSQALKAGGAVNLESPFNTFYNRSRSIRTFNAWSAASVASIHFCEFNPPGSSDGNLIDQFIDPAIDLHLVPNNTRYVFKKIYDSMPRSNLSIPREFFAVAASLNQYLNSFQFSPKVLREKRSKGMQHLANADSSRGGGLFTADALQRWLLQADQWESLYQDELGGLKFSADFYQCRSHFDWLDAHCKRQSVVLSSSEQSLLDEVLRHL